MWKKVLSLGGVLIVVYLFVDNATSGGNLIATGGKATSGIIRTLQGR